MTREDVCNCPPVLSQPSILLVAPATVRQGARLPSQITLPVKVARASFGVNAHLLTRITERELSDQDALVHSFPGCGTTGTKHLLPLKWLLAHLPVISYWQLITS